MDIRQELSKELTSEYETTKKFLAHYPEEKNDWKPHVKSGSMIWLVQHIVEIFGWPKTILDTPYLDFAASPYAPVPVTTRKELEEKLDAKYTSSAETLKNLVLEDLDGTWDIRQGDMIFMQWSKYGAIRHSLQQITHHRAQLGVYYRLNDITVPASYGPSADEQ